MCNNILISPYVKDRYFSAHLFDQPLQKKSNLLRYFRLIEYQIIHVLCQYTTFILNNIFLHKKVNVQFYLRKNVFFSWGLNL
ncbi:MAG: hypothetical protein CL916_00950 [Deltaproteobacteria bacterium]|nr:hypothetical protein [Deltaproteobacteria bacterium]